MNLIQASIKKPVSVIVGVILVVLFGLIGLQFLPYQLTPDVTEPEITITTLWPGATPMRSSGRSSRSRSGPSREFQVWWRWKAPRLMIREASP
jgi:hypothetical protein